MNKDGNFPTKSHSLGQTQMRSGTKTMKPAQISKVAVGFFFFFVDGFR